MCLKDFVGLEQKHFFVSLSWWTTLLRFCRTLLHCNPNGESLFIFCFLHDQKIGCCKDGITMQNIFFFPSGHIAMHLPNDVRTSACRKQYCLAICWLWNYDEWIKSRVVIVTVKQMRKKKDQHITLIIICTALNLRIQPKQPTNNVLTTQCEVHSWYELHMGSFLEHL